MSKVGKNLKNIPYDGIFFEYCLPLLADVLFFAPKVIMAGRRDGENS